MDNSSLFMRMNCNETLLNLCLSIVVNLAKTEKLNPELIKDLPKNLRYSLLNIFSKRGFLNDQNIHVFLNESTKSLELSDCDKLTDLGLEQVSKCKYLAKIDLNSHNIPRTLITSNGISNLANKCGYMQSILLRRCIEVDDVCIDTIARSCPRITHLNIANCPLVTDNALISLGKHCHHLKSINLSGTRITDKGVFALFSKENISKTIEEVHIAHCDLITDESIECILLNCSKVKYLLFHCCPSVTDASRLALEDYMTNNSNQKVQHLTWTIY